VERLPGFAADDAQKTLRFQRACVARALDSGCKPAEDALKREGAAVSNDTIARYVKAAAAQQIDANLTRNDVRVLAVDDIYLRKGDKSSGCTVFLDEETHRVLIIVRGTTKAVVKPVLESFPAATFFSRDRASAYATAAAECEKTQVADRFHLIENAHQAVQDALMTILPATIFLRDGDGWVPADPGTGRLPGRPVFTVPEDQVEARIRLAQLTPNKAQKYRHTLKLLELADQGLRSAEIALTLGIPLKEVQQLRRSAVNTLDTVEAKIHAQIQQANDTRNHRADRWQERHPKTLRPQARPSPDSIVEPYRDTVIRELQHGGNHRTIYPLLQQQGFEGSGNAVYQYILKLRQEIPEVLRPAPLDPPADLQLQQISRDTVYKQVLKHAADSRPKEAEPQPNTASKPDAVTPKTRPSAPSPFSDKARALIFGENAAEDPTPSSKTSQDQDQEQKKKQTQQRFEALVGCYPVIGMLVQFLSDCYHVFDAADPAALEAFIQQYQACEIGPLAQYATGLEKDFEAVKNSLIYREISNGPLEGTNSRIKMKHRRGGGRAGIELLNAYNVLTAEDLAG
jgi:transposase-like protein